MAASIWTRIASIGIGLLASAGVSAQTLSIGTGGQDQFFQALVVYQPHRSPRSVQTTAAFPRVICVALTWG